MSAEKIAIVTGGASGIGLDTVRGLARAGLRVIAGCRKPARAEGEGWALDLADLASVRAFAERARAELPRLDVLVANAGVWPSERRTTADGFELCFGVNHLGHAALIAGLRPLLERSAARTVVISSGLHARGRMRWDDLMMTRGRYDGMDAYAQSKLANVLYTFALARRLEGGATANACHPGVVRTRLAREFPHMQRASGLSPAEGAEAALHLALAPALAGVTGRYFDRTHPRKPSPIALDHGSQERLWSVTERLLAPPTNGVRARRRADALARRPVGRR